jgi:formimidoylglutamate deiminase
MAAAPGASTGASLLRAALRGGAQALGSETGVAAGKPMDMLSLDAHDAAFIGRSGDALIDGWVFTGGKVDCVWRAGRKVVEQGRHIGMAPIARAYRRTLERLLKV